MFPVPVPPSRLVLGVKQARKKKRKVNARLARYLTMNRYTRVFVFFLPCLLQFNFNPCMRFFRVATSVRTRSVTWLRTFRDHDRDMKVGISVCVIQGGLVPGGWVHR